MISSQVLVDESNGIWKDIFALFELDAKSHCFLRFALQSWLRPCYQIIFRFQLKDGSLEWRAVLF